MQSPLGPATRAWLVACSLLALPTGCRSATDSANASCGPEAALALYQRKIEPILRDDRPASCNQCHLPGIDLSLFVKDTPCQTMACLKQLGLVDFGEPEQSVVLGWIGRATPESSLITEQVIDQEYQAMLEWIRYSASCQAQPCGTFTDPCNAKIADATTRCDVALQVGADFMDPGDCRELTLEKLFSAEVYQWRERCNPCHFRSDMLVPEAPKWISDVPLQRTDPALACSSGSLETMRTVLERGYVNLAKPERSLILLKPLSAEGGGVAHGGGPKFDGPADPSYQSFLAWIRRYATCADEEPGLPKANPPAPTSSDAGVNTSASGSSVYDYCNCMLFNCHDPAHARWGESDPEMLAGCRAAALAVPAHGAETMSGNFIECRAVFCEKGRADPDACWAALGDITCR